MTDLTMCLNRECPSRMTCYRFTATPGYKQSYAAFGDNAIASGHDKCEAYVSNEDKED